MDLEKFITIFLHHIPNDCTDEVQNQSSKLELPLHLVSNPLYEATEGLYDEIMHSSNLKPIKGTINDAPFRSQIPYHIIQSHNNGPTSPSLRSPNFASFLTTNKDGPEDDYVDMSVQAPPYISDV